LISAVGKFLFENSKHATIMKAHIDREVTGVAIIVIILAIFALIALLSIII